jgi:hypothetical protein
MKTTPQLDSFFKHFVKAMREGNAAVFVGAGLSRSCGYVDWKGLLKDLATELGLDIDQETDLIALAQFHQTKHMNRAKLDRLIIEEFTKDTSLSDNHRLLARLPIDTVWTTNYDKLLEDAFRDAHRRVDAKKTPDSLQLPLPGRSVTVYKMHGDVDSPQDAVLTKEDYETYDLTRELFSIKLKGDIVGKTFLFLGFSFTDPNIDYILSRIRALLGKDKGQHYAIMRWPPKPKKADFPKDSDYQKAKARHAYERTRLDLRIGDLKRYGIEALMIDEYSEITAILTELNRRVHLRDVCVSGSAATYDPLGEPAVTKICRLLGNRLITEGLNVVSGLGVGIGDQVVIGALESLYQRHYYDASDRLFLRPFPQTPPAGMTIPQFWTKYRTEMLSMAGACIFVCGNKRDNSSGTIVEANGVLEEFQIAVGQGVFPIPLGATGHAAKRIWDEVNKNLTKFFPDGGVKDHFATLGKHTSTPEQIVDAVIGILKQLKAI